MTDHDNQFTDAAQLVATHRAAHADTATARLAQVSPDADDGERLRREVEAGWRYITCSKAELQELFDRIEGLERENERLRYIAEYFMDGYWETVHIGIPYQRLTVTIQQEQLNALRAKMALDADGERAG